MERAPGELAVRASVGGVDYCDGGAGDAEGEVPRGQGRGVVAAGVGAAETAVSGFVLGHGST